MKIGRRQFLYSSTAALAGLGIPPGEPQEQQRRERISECFSPSSSNQLLPNSEKPLGRREQCFMPHAVFQELQLTQVAPLGWLHEELSKQATHLAIPQNNFCFPFDRRYWASNERGEDLESRNGGIWWYPWEQVGYWTDGAYRCAAVLGHAHLFRRARAPIVYTVTNPVDGWFLGPRRLYSPPGTDDPDLKPDRWPHAVFFRALAAAAEAENDSEILRSMCRHYLNDNLSDYQHGAYGPRDRVNIESILWCYAHSGDSRLLKKAQDIWSQIPQSDLVSLSDDRPSHMHGVTFAELSKMAAIMYLYTGDQGQLDLARSAMRRVFKYHMLPDGTPSTSENLAKTTSVDGHETCDIVEFNLAWGYLLMATGDGGYGDRIERALFNAGMGAVRKDWTGFQYISCPNQLHLARNSCQVGHKGTAAALYGPNSDHRPEYKFITACCAGNVNRMLPTYVQRMWMLSSDQGLAAVLYGPSRVRTQIGGGWVEIVENTLYPFSERIDLLIRCKHSAIFPLHLRIPAWCQRPELTINNKLVDLSERKSGFAIIRRKYSDGDILSLQLPMRLSIGRSSDGGVFLERGPLVYALRPGEDWRALFMPEFEITSPDYFPMWAASAGSPWNYGLAIGRSSSLENEIRQVKTERNEDPWIEPPIALEAPARRIEGWSLQHPNGDDQEWFRTPPLPSGMNQIGSLERIKLVPLGSTHLRLSVFPTVPRE